MSGVWIITVTHVERVLAQSLGNNGRSSQRGRNDESRWGDGFDGGLLGFPKRKEVWGEMCRLIRKKSRRMSVIVSVRFRACASRH